MCLLKYYKSFKSFKISNKSYIFIFYTLSYNIKFIKPHKAKVIKAHIPINYDDNLYRYSLVNKIFVQFKLLLLIQILWKTDFIIREMKVKLCQREGERQGESNVWKRSRRLSIYKEYYKEQNKSNA